MVIWLRYRGTLLHRPRPPGWTGFVCVDAISNRFFRYTTGEQLA
ncbi:MULTISPECIES: hypothetical protein [Nostocales]|nr:MULTISPECIES: hypothetical protein [Nostocales]